MNYNIVMISLCISLCSLAKTNIILCNIKNTVGGVMSAKWWYSNFLYLYPPQKIDFKDYPCMKIFSQELRILGEGLQHLGEDQM